MASAAAISLLLDAPADVKPPQHTLRRFTVWNGVNINHPTIEALAQAVYALVPLGVWDEVELLIKAGEGGSWQARILHPSWGDPSPLAISSAADLASEINQAKQFGLRLTPYVVVRGIGSAPGEDWRPFEQRQIRECVDIAGRCVLNLEPGRDLYWGGPFDAAGIRDYLRGIDVDPDQLEVCAIPRAAQVAEIGGPQALQAWTDPSLVGAASWETYDGTAYASPPGSTSLAPDQAIPRLDGWGVPEGAQYRICVVNRSRIGAWADTSWAAPGLACWHLDGD